MIYFTDNNFKVKIIKINENPCYKGVYKNNVPPSSDMSMAPRLYQGYVKPRLKLWFEFFNIALI